MGMGYEIEKPSMDESLGMKARDFDTEVARLIHAVTLRAIGVTDNQIAKAWADVLARPEDLEDARDFARKMVQAVDTARASVALGEGT